MDGGALLDTGAYALSFARYFLTSQSNEILSTAKPTVDEQSGIILKNLDNFTRPDKAVITYANGKTEMIEEGETAKGLNYEVEDMLAEVLTKQAARPSVSPWMS